MAAGRSVSLAPLTGPQEVAALPEAQREVFLLREEAGFGLEEIARATNARPETVRNRLRQAVGFLRQGMRGGD